jgi:murein DD-endopeptidase MepM/ murein hydrolase activator NlpD
MASPIPGYRVTTGYKVPGNWSAGFHTGVDHAAPSGTRVNAIASGKVIHVGWGGWGNSYGVQVIILHGRYRTMVAHLSRTTVRNGQSVSAGQQVGNVGTTGNSTGPHVHVETREFPFDYNYQITNPTLLYGSAPSPSPAPSPQPEEDAEMNVILINYKGDRYACYPSAGVKRRIGSPKQETNISNITKKAGGKVIEWSAGKDVDDPNAFGLTIT